MTHLTYIVAVMNPLDAMNPSSGSPPYPPSMVSGGTGNAAPRSNSGDAGPEAHASDVDVKLVRRMQSGDQAALGEFYDRWFPVVNCLIMRMLKAAGDAEDVVEETFWQAWKQAGRYAPERGTVQTWLLTMARSRALDRLRANRRRREESIDDHDAPAFATSAESPNDPSLDVEHSERRQMVLAALAELPPEQRQALELGYFSGLSQTEIAERTGQPLGTIKTRMRLAMLKLRERLSVLREEAR
jgi:RNA polymerase sigma-70 factor (ECF subfamily)